MNLTSWKNIDFALKTLYLRTSSIRIKFKFECYCLMIKYMQEPIWALFG